MRCSSSSISIVTSDGKLAGTPWQIHTAPAARSNRVANLKDVLGIQGDIFVSLLQQGNTYTVARPSRHVDTISRVTDSAVLRELEMSRMIDVSREWE